MELTLLRRLEAFANGYWRVSETERVGWGCVRQLPSDLSALQKGLPSAGGLCRRQNEPQPRPASDPLQSTVLRQSVSSAPAVSPELRMRQDAPRPGCPKQVATGLAEVGPAPLWSTRWQDLMCAAAPVPLSAGPHMALVCASILPSDSRLRRAPHLPPSLGLILAQCLLIAAWREPGFHPVLCSRRPVPHDRPGSRASRGAAWSDRQWASYWRIPVSPCPSWRPASAQVSPASTSGWSRRCSAWAPYLGAPSAR